MAQESRERAGRDLYFGRGTGGLAAEIGGASMPGIACSQCHGRDALGSREGRWSAPAIDGSALSSANAERPAYDAKTFGRALTDGVSPGGRTLGIGMPRFHAGDEAAAALWQFLLDLPRKERAGVLPDEVRLAIAAEPSGEADAVGMLRALERAWAKRGAPLVNLRRLRFETVLVEDVEGEPPAALVESFAAIGVEPGGARGLVSRLSRLGIPVLGAARYPDADEEALPGVVWLTAGQTALDAAMARMDAESKASAEGSDAGSGKTRPAAGLLVVTEIGRLPAAAGRSAVLLPFAFLQQAPDAVGALIRSGSSVLAARPAGDIEDSETVARVLAELLETSLLQAGRDLTRSSWLSALAAARIAPAGWPELDYPRYPRTGTGEVEFILLLPSAPRP